MQTKVHEDYLRYHQHQLYYNNLHLIHTWTLIKFSLMVNFVEWWRNPHWSQSILFLCILPIYANNISLFKRMDMINWQFIFLKFWRNWIRLHLHTSCWHWLFENISNWKRTKAITRRKFDFFATSWFDYDILCLWISEINYTLLPWRK